MLGASVGIQELIQSRSRRLHDAAGRETLVLTEDDALHIAWLSGALVYDVYKEALQLKICPYRYLRNREAVSVEEQLRLCRSRVIIVGAGGLGGHVILLLARLGIGHIVVVDSDRFEETNLNRQVLASMHSLGKSKAQEAVSAVMAVNPAVKTTGHAVKIDASNARDLLTAADAIVDALDNIPDRFVLEAAARSLKIPMVHGALAGFEGQVMTIFPEDPGLEQLYGNSRQVGHGKEHHRSQDPEALLGAPSLTPSLIASLQTGEVLKILLNRGRLFRKRMLHVDLETGEINSFSFGEAE